MLKKNCSKHSEDNQAAAFQFLTCLNLSYLKPPLLILLHMFSECHQIISIQVKKPVRSLKYKYRKID